jgi:hypothetical protein
MTGTQADRHNLMPDEANDRRNLTILTAVARSMAEVVTEAELHEIFAKSEARLPLELQGHDWNNVQLFLVAMHDTHKDKTSFTRSK